MPLRITGKNVDIGQALRRCTPRAIGVTVRNTDDCYFSSQAFFLSDIRQIVQILRRRSEAPIVLGGVEASMRRVAHYDFWSNSVRRSSCRRCKWARAGSAV